MDDIFFSDILNIPEEELNQYKIQFHIRNEDGENLEPLSVMSQDMETLKEKWIAWKGKKEAKNELNRKFVIAFVQYYTASPDQWIFAGGYEISQKKDFDIIENAAAYDLKTLEKYEKFTKKLVLSFKLEGRNRKRNAETIMNDIKVAEILKEEYAGIAFNGYENITLSFRDLEGIKKNNVSVWKTKLENITGIYMLFDRETGKKYVGSAYGEEGIWQRWSYYIKSIHGDNIQLKKLPDGHIKDNFIFSLLEWHKIGTAESFIISRENYWKEVLMSRKYGYNDN